MHSTSALCVLSVILEYGSSSRVILEHSRPYVHISVACLELNCSCSCTIEGLGRDDGMVITPIK